LSAGSFFFDAGAVILVIFTVVFVHESGHFVFAKLSGIQVDEFAIGFGPRIVSRRRGETLYSIRALPLGGFVRMAGMLGLEGESDAGARNFYRASIPKRFITIAAGIVFNFVFAAVCFAAIDMQSSTAHVQVGSPAAHAGLHDGDVIVSLNAHPIRHDSPSDTSADLHAATSTSQGLPMTLVYRTASGAARTTTIRPELVIVNFAAGPLEGNLLAVTSIDGHPVGTGDPASLLRGAHVGGYVENPDGSPGRTFSDFTVGTVTTGFGAPAQRQADWFIGIQATSAGLPLGLAEQKGEALLPALGDGFAAIPSFIHQTVSGLYQLATTPSEGGFNGPNGLSGPVGIARATVTAANSGGTFFIFWLAFISMNLGFINLLPIPFLDGGKLLFVIIEAIRRRRIDPRREALAYAIGLAIVVLLLIYVTIGDVSSNRI